MTYEIRIIDLTKFFIMVIGAVFLSVFGMLFIAIQINASTPIFFSFPIIILIFITSQNIFSKTLQFKLENGIFSFQNMEISLHEIQGYYVDGNVSMTAFNLKLKNGKIIRHTISTTRKWKSGYVEFINDFEKLIKGENLEIRRLTYAEVYPKSGKFIKFTMYVGVPIVVIIDLITVFTFIQGEPFFPWQILFINFYLLTLIPYVKGNKQGK